MSLHVLSVAFPFAPVGPDSPGGAEQVLSLLDQALVREGHGSTVIASSGTAAGKLVRVEEEPTGIDENARTAAQAAHRDAIQRVLETEEIDLIHLHGLDFCEYLPPAGKPTLVTLHLPPEWYLGEAFTVDRPATYLHCVSAAQERSCPACESLMPAIPNGVDVEAFFFHRRKDDFVFSVGRICPEKGYHFAVEAARRSGFPLVLGGKVFPYAEHVRYYSEVLEPQLGPDFRFIGPVGFARKKRLLSAARCLLVPSLAPETSSLVAMEALASGTPVIAFPAGALPEIVEHGRTGFIVRNAEEMAEAIAAIDQIDPEACREAAEQRFSARVMAQRYFERYESILRHQDKRRRPA